MDQPGFKISALDCDILRSIFVKSVSQANVPEIKWRTEAALLIRDFTGSNVIDPDLLEWIVRK